ncbi:hypothetical protein AAC387_Pa04g0461 [Persea americana]
MTTLDILEQQPASTQGNNINKNLKARQGVSPTSLSTVQQALMVVAALIVTITFQAGLSPPWGLWKDSIGANQADHKTGKASQSTKDQWLVTVFTAVDAIAFTLSLALIPIAMTWGYRPMSILILPKI